MDHPMIVQIEKTGHPHGYEETTYYCDNCGDWIDDDVFELEGDIYCSVKCLTDCTDIRYGHISEFK